jgi:hypothetical protein
MFRFLLRITTRVEKQMGAAPGTLRKDAVLCR